VTGFGNLDLSILDEMPKNRKEIITEIISTKERENTYEFIRKEIKSGRQAFVILPLVEESKVLTEVKAAVEEHKKLSKKKGILQSECPFHRLLDLALIRGVLLLYPPQF